MSKTASIIPDSVRVRPPLHSSRSLAYRASYAQPALAPAPQPTLVRPVKVSVSIVVLQVTILPALLNSLQQAVAASCGKVANILGTDPLPRSQSIRVRLGIDAVSVNAAMEAIIRALPSGEIGRIAAL